MENFIVSARKYRPVTFDTVIGQNAITTTLKNAIKNGQLAQAFLFTGPRGVGKTTCARILAKTINCKNITKDVEPCNVCESCKAFNTSASFNIHELDAASNNSVDDIRSLVEQVRIPPQGVKYKVYIIDEVHMLSAQAFNAFLKTLEEPPTYAKFILATTEKHKILPTILSRCQIFDFNRITVDDIAKHLEFVAKNENIGAEIEALHLIAQKADGALRDALSIFDQIASFSGASITYDNVIDNLNILDVYSYFEITDYILHNNVTQALLKVNSIIEKGHDAHNFINGLGDHLRNLLVCRDIETIVLLEVSPAVKEEYKKQSQGCIPELLLKGLEICNKADINYKTVGNKRLLIELSVLQMCALCNKKEEDKNIYNDKPYSLPKAVTPPPQVVKKTEDVPIPKVTLEEPKPIKKEEKNELSKGSVSFSSLYNTPSKSEETVSENTQAIKEEVLPTDDFSDDKLIALWNNYADLEQHSPNFKSVLTNNAPQKNDNNTIMLNVINTFQEEEIKANMPELLTFLRNGLNNQLITIEINIIPVEENKTVKPFTVKDKFKSMSEKNPDVIKLKNKLELDLDY